MNSEVNRSVAGEGEGWDAYVNSLKQRVDQSRQAAEQPDATTVFESEQNRVLEFEAV